MRASTTFTFGTFAACALSACNPSAFDSLLDEAPVLSLSPGGSSTSSLAVLPLLANEPGTTAAARVLMSVRDEVRIAVADIDLKGKATITQASDVDLQNLNGYPAYSMATRADGRIILGSPKAGGSATPGGGLAVLDVGSPAGGGHTFTITPSIQAGVSNGSSPSRLGIAVAAGNVTNIPQGNFVAVGDNTVQVLDATGTAAAAATEAGCPTVLYDTTELYPHRSIAAGNVLLEGPPPLGGAFDEIVLAMPGKVVFVRWDGTAKLPCPSEYITMGSLGFGRSVAIGDFNGDSKQDLAVGNPPDTVYVFFGPLDPLVVPGVKATPSVTIKSGAMTGFGERVATYYLQGMAAAQLLVTDAGATVDGRQGAGKVMLFNPNGQYPVLTEANALATLFDSTDDSDPGLFGLSMGGLPFNPQFCSGGAVQLVPWAANGPNLLTFFNYPGAVSDPRCIAP